MSQKLLQKPKPNPANQCSIPSNPCQISNGPLPTDKKVLKCENNLLEFYNDVDSSGYSCKCYPCWSGKNCQQHTCQCQCTHGAATNTCHSDKYDSCRKVGLGERKMEVAHID